MGGGALPPDFAQALIDCNRAVAGTDFRGELRKVTVPTLVIHGDSDQSAPLDLTGEEDRAADPREPA